MRGLMVNRGWAIIFGVLALLVLGSEMLRTLPSFSSSVAVAQDPPEEGAPAEEAPADGAPTEAPSENFLLWFIGALGGK